MKNQTYLTVDHDETPRLLHLPWRRILMIVGVLVAALFPAEALVQTLL
jgi:hypothetical protein